MNASAADAPLQAPRADAVARVRNLMPFSGVAFLWFIGVPRDKLFERLNQGLDDIAAANLTVTDERLKVADFVAPEDRKPVREIIVTGPASPKLESLDDLAGRTVYVRRSSSHHASLAILDQQLRAKGRVG